MNAIRYVMSVLFTKESSLELFNNVAPKFKGEKIYIVTAYSYGKGVFSSPEVVEKGQKKSEEFLNKILQSEVVRY